jgi:WD40 repeat protein
MSSDLIVFAPTLDYIAAVYYNTSVQIRSVEESNAVLKTIGPLRHRINKIVYSPDGRLLACALRVGAHDFEQPPFWHRNDWTSSGEKSSSSSSDREDDEDEENDKEDADDESQEDESYDDDDEENDFDDDESVITIYNVHTSLLVKTIRWRGGDRYCFAFSPDSQQIATSVCDDEFDVAIFIWNIETGARKKLAGFKSIVDEIECIAFSADGSRLVAGSCYGIGVWELATCHLQVQCDDWPTPCVMFAPDDNNRIAFVDMYDDVSIMELGEYESAQDKTLDHSSILQYRSVAIVGFSRNGKYLATTRYEAGTKTLLIWDVAEAQLVRQRLISSESDCACVAFSADGSFIYICAATVVDDEAFINKWQLVDRRPMTDRALALLQCGVAPYAALDIIDLLVADAGQHCFNVESTLLHYNKIKLIERVQQICNELRERMVTTKCLKT